jgi:tetratricopeptide (TPR) repeat protein
MIRNERFIPADAGDYAADAERARSLLGAGDIDQAIAHYDEALRANPFYADGFNNRGLAWLRKGNLERAIEDFSEAIRLQPDSEARYIRGIVYKETGELARAMADFSQVIRRNPRHHQALYQRALCHALTGEQSLARDDYRQAVVLNPALAKNPELGQVLRARRRGAVLPFLKAFACAVVGAALGAAIATPLSVEILATAILPALITGYLAWRSAKPWPFWRIAVTFAVMFLALVPLVAYATRGL